MAGPMRLKTVAFLLGGVIGFGVIQGCTHAPAPPNSPPAPSESSSPSSVKVVRPRDMTDAALQPFADVGLKQEKIPPLLKAIKTPYANDAPLDCQSIGAAILELDIVLGQDVDVRLAEKTLRDKGADAAGEALVDAVESTSTSVIPFRGLVREVSGASGRDRRAAAAVQAGKLRRAYLKGIGQTLGCQPPAAPLPYKE